MIIVYTYMYVSVIRNKTVMMCLKTYCISTLQNPAIMTSPTH